MISKTSLVIHAMTSFSVIPPHDVDFETRHLLQEMHIRYRPGDAQKEAEFLIESSETEPGEPQLSLRLPFQAVRHMLLAAVMGGATEGISPATLTWLLTEFYTPWDEEDEFLRAWREEVDEAEAAR